MEKNLKPIGALLSDSWNVYKKHMNVFALICVIPFLFTGAKLALLPYLYNAWGQPLSLAALSISAIFGLLYLVFVIAMPFAMSVAVHEAESGKMPNANAVYKRTFSSIFPYLLIILLTLVIVFGGSIIFIIPGIVASIYLSLAMYVFIFEGKSNIDALVTSAWYVRNFWWDILARKIILAILSIVAIIVFAIVLAAVIFFLGFNTAIFQFILDLFIFMIVVPFALTVSYNIYKDVKHTQEARERKNPTAAFTVEAERFYVILIIVAAVTAILLFIVINLQPEIFLSFNSPMNGPMMYHSGMTMHHHYQQYQGY